MPLLDRQTSITPQRGMPVEDRHSTSALVTVSGETVQFYYSNAGVRTIDAGQAAGSFVVGVLNFRTVMNSGGSMQATNLDTSLSFTSTALTTEVPFPFMVAEGMDEVSWANRLSFMSGYLTANGQYCVDYAHGIIYGRKASTQVTLTSTTYKVLSSSVIATGNIPSGSTDSGNPVKIGGVYNTTAPTLTNGQRGDAQMDVRANLAMTLGTLISGEDQTNGVMKTESQFTGQTCTADTQVKAAPGFLNSLTFFCTDAAPTAGSIIVYDNTAESGTVICNLQVSTTFFNPFTLMFNRLLTTGLYVGFTTTADVAVQTSFR